MKFVRIDEWELGALQRVVQFLASEALNYDKQGEPDEHIWCSVRVLRKWLDEITGSFQALDSHMQTVAEHLLSEGVPIEEWPNRIVVEDDNGGTRLIWSLNECRHVPVVEKKL